MPTGVVTSRNNFLYPCYRDLGINKERINEAIASALDIVKKAGITLTAPLPFSTRSIPHNLIRAPIRLIQCAKAAIAPAMKEKSLKVFKEITITKLKAYIKIDWKGGIKDSYKDLSIKPRHQLEKAKRLKILQEGQIYAKLQYCNQEGRYEKNVEAYLSTSKVPYFNNQVKNCFNDVKRKIQELGFKEDDRGGFYNKGTGALFNLAYNEKTNELALCFHGLTNEDKLQGEIITPKLKKEIQLKNKLYAALDWLGTITPIGVEAIKLGQILDESTRNNNLNAVVIGHSHGGGLAQCAALANGLKGVVFNSRPVGAWYETLYRTGQNSLKCA